jgi:hypothetical protein
LGGDGFTARLLLEIDDHAGRDILFASGGALNYLSFNSLSANGPSAQTCLNVVHQGGAVALRDCTPLQTSGPGINYDSEGGLSLDRIAFATVQEGIKHCKFSRINPTPYLSTLRSGRIPRSKTLGVLVVKFLVYSIILVGATGCFNGSSVAGPGSSNSNTAQADSFTEQKLDDPVETPAADVPFGAFYGNFTVTECVNRSTEAKGLDYCGFEVLAVFGSKLDPAGTMLSLRKRLDAHSIEYRDEPIVKQTQFGSNYRESGVDFASQTSAIDNDNQKEYREITFKKISASRFKLTRKLSVWIDAGQWKDRREVDFELTLERR